MEIYHKIIKIIDANIILCLIPLILTIILIKIIFKERFQTMQVLNLVRWTIITYTIITTSYFLIGITFFQNEFANLNRATGPYSIAYWLMLLCATIFPLTLFYKKLGLKSFYLLFVAVIMKMGWYFERFVIIVTSYYRDYSPDNVRSNEVTFLNTGILVWILQGFILAILLHGLFEIIEGIKTAHNS